MALKNLYTGVLWCKNIFLEVDDGSSQMKWAWEEGELLGWIQTTLQQTRREKHKVWNDHHGLNSCRASGAVLGDCLELISRVEHCKGPCCNGDCASLTQGWHRAQDMELRVLSASCLSLFCQNLPYPAQEQSTTPALLHSKSWMKHFGLDYLNFTELWPHLPRPRIRTNPFKIFYQQLLQEVV